MPDKSVLRETIERDETNIKNSEIKDLRIAEKRDFELENCKLNAYSNQKDKAPGEEEPEKPKKQVRIILNQGNKFATESKVVENINVFEISNSQLF